MKAGYLAAIGLGLMACSQAASDVEAVGTNQFPLDTMIFSPYQAVLTAAPWTGTDAELPAADAYYNCTMVQEYGLDGSSGASLRRDFLHANDKFIEASTSSMDHG